MMHAFKRLHDKVYRVKVYKIKQQYKRLWRQ